MLQESPSKSRAQRDNFSEPLVMIQQASIAIFPDKIIQYAKRKQITMSTFDTTAISLSELDPNCKILSFSKNDIAFKIEEDMNRISIIKVKNQKVELQFVVQKLSQLVNVREILRRKLCQIGFQQKFKIIKQLGKGATAKVYLTERISDGRLFAAKIISLKQSENKQYETFINETKILKCLKNSHIVEIQSLYISKKDLICVLEFLQGGTLLDELKNDVIKTPRQRLRALKDITDGLQHLRQKRIVHRDIKLENILVRINKDKSKSYVISDFGLACWMGQKQLLYQKCGTPGYIAPQILKAPKGKIIVAHTSDIFSLGVIFHFIFLLKPVFLSFGNPQELLQQNKKASFSLQTKNHIALMESEQILLKRTLQLEVSKRTTSRELIDIYLVNYENQIEQMENRRRAVSSKQVKLREQMMKCCKSMASNHSNSIEIIQKRPPSMDKKQFSNRFKTQTSEKKPEKRQGSIEKIINYFTNRSSSTQPKTQVLKKKQNPSNRKQQMKSFVT